MGRCVSHDFYCLQCGQRGIPLARKVGQERSALHRKKLYCYHCKTDINHVEIRNQFELETFKTNFANGVYVDECKESLDYCRSTFIG